ncbi:CHASE2 domain-containing serine/threonine-protein kinase [Roseofilum sp. BLCC_M154]|uniref:non-specific serine/threonine protein kinase n=1 Tax=Roseofilum acuticapitatum BLCC-M154 TaxID=3022444 RepID=A0ABT7AUR7_9CYAN|nr:CHASE2 domain-containing serine/threonine-protein kinase [Roseofilum acuticapitatum]MDJ1170046.1 CHASE2 domain-containing serine/threonine-protein kinase [Roseofilum acuticapitatum BLCC-M154]
MKTSLPLWQRCRSLVCEQIWPKLCQRWQDPQNSWIDWMSVGNSVVIVTLTTTALLVALRKLGWTEYPELLIYDQFTQWRAIAKTDDRLLIIGITEEDIQAQQRYPLSDETIYELIQKLEAHNPRVIGLDIYRDIPQNPGREQLMTYLQGENNRTVTVCQLSKGDDDIGVPPPPEVQNQHLGFADVVIDEDGVIRRSLLWGKPFPSSKCQVKQAFSLQLTRHYLQDENIDVKPSEGTLMLGSVPLTRLEPNTGGYQGVDAQGYQILLKYHSPDRVARKVTLMDVLEERVDPSWIRDRIILIGLTAPSVNDFFYTPYSRGQDINHQMAGVEIHAQIISQLLNAALDDQPLMSTWSDRLEILWILGWAAVGAALSWKITHPLVLSGTLAIAVFGLAGSSWGLFESSVWVPLFSPVVGLLVSSGGVFGYSSYQTQKIQEHMAQRVQQQEQDLKLLQTFLEEQTKGQGLTQLDDSDNTQTWTDTEGDDEEDCTQIAPENTEEWTQPMSLLGGRYHITKVLGAGGFGQTYLAQDIQRPRHPICVIKHLRPVQTDGNFFQVAQRLFKTEAEILDILGQHDQIPQLFAYFEEHQEFYLVEEYIEGSSLSDELGEDKRLEVSQVMELTFDILQVLTFVHHYQVIHRDIKPSNIIRRQSDRRLCLIDFGAVKQFAPHLEEETERFTVAIGTKGYAAPEQLMGQPRLCSDIYSVGMIAIHALTGISPQKLRQDWGTGSAVWHHLVESTVSVELMDILDTMVAYHFRDRYPSAVEAIDALKKINH